MYLSRGGVQAICLADGAGSAAHSEFGAQAVVDEGCRVLVEQFEDFAAAADGVHVKADILKRLLLRLNEVAGRRDCDLTDLATTFACVAVSGARFLGAHIGDGVVGYVKNDRLEVISAPHNGEFANQTTFVTSGDAALSMRLFRGSLVGVSGFILMSDGTADSLFSPRTGQLAEACSKLITSVGGTPAKRAKYSSHTKELRKFVGVRVRAATKDDCSIAILATDEPVSIDVDQA